MYTSRVNNNQNLTQTSLNKPIHGWQLFLNFLLHIASNQDGEMENNFITVNGRYLNRHRKWKKSEAFHKNHTGPGVLHIS